MEETLDFHEQIKKLIEERRFKELRVLFAESNAIDIAEALYGLSEKELIYAFRMLSKEQAADAFALDVDIAPDGRTLDNLKRYYRELGYLDTGFIGTDILFDVLFREGEADLAYDLLTTEQMGGYLWMKRQGATTIYEYLNGAGSHCHPMFGAPVKYLFRHMLGICKHFITEIPRVEERIRIAPMIPRNAGHMSGSIATAQGDISVSWKREGESVEINVGVPEGIRATFAYAGMETELHPGETCFIFH